MSNEQRLRDKIAELEKRIEALRKGLLERCHDQHFQRPDFMRPDECPTCALIAADDAASLPTGEQVTENK